MPDDTFTPDDRADAEIWVAIGYHLDQAQGLLGDPLASRATIRFHLSEVKRQLLFVCDADVEDGGGA